MPRTWDKVSLPGAADRIAHDADGNLIAFASGTAANVFYSEDLGATWSSVANPLGAGNHSWIAHDQSGLWVMSGSAGEIATSPDGAAWTTRTSGVATSLQGLAHGNGLWVAGGAAASTVITSPDGVTWTSTSIGVISPSGGMPTVAHNGVDRFTGVRRSSSGGPRICTSTDGASWSNSAVVSGFTATSFAKIAYGNGLWVICEKETSGIPGILTSTDGENFSAVTPTGFTATGNPGPVVYLPHLDLWLALPATGEVSASEDGGITWDLLDLSEFSALNVTLNNGAGVASGGAVTGIDDTGGTPANTAFVNLYTPPPSVFWTGFVGCEENL